MANPHDMIVTFPGGKKVDAEFMGHIIKTDQHPRSGGEGSAPEPYALFLASLGACAGIYVLGFCQSRGLPTEGIRLVQSLEPDATGKIGKINIHIEVPSSFPEKYHEALVRSADQCAVKKTIQNPPQFEIKTVVTA
jgi:ribosomal protein S12 methylthiotransferase accessory factor